MENINKHKANGVIKREATFGSNVTEDKYLRRYK